MDIDYSQGTAAHHARLIAHTRRAGRPRGAHEVIIAAHAALGIGMDHDSYTLGKRPPGRSLS